MKSFKHQPLNENLPDSFVSGNLDSKEEKKENMKESYYQEKAFSQTEAREEKIEIKNVTKDKYIKEEGFENPHDQASLLKKIFFLQYLPLIFQSFKTFQFKNRLTLDDIPSLAKSEDHSKISDELWQAINLETENFSKPISAKILCYICFRLFKWKYLFSSLLMASHIILQISFGYFLQKIIENLSDHRQSYAYISAGSLCGAIAADMILKNHLYFRMIRFGAKLRCAITTILYWKILTLNNYTIQNANMGKLVNIVASDLNNIEYKIIYFPIILATPLVLCFFLYLLLNLFGWTCLIGVLVFLLLFIIKSILLRQNTENLTRRNNLSDSRVKHCNEVIDGIRLIKIYGWENSFRDTILAIRDQEVSVSKTYNLVFYTAIALSLNSSFLAIFFIFLPYYNIIGNINNNHVFSYIQYFESFRISCVSEMVYTISFVFEIPIIFQRISEILNIRTKQYLAIESNIYMDKKHSISVLLENFTAFWKLSAENVVDAINNTPVLKNISLTIGKGSLNCVLGSVGSGKSSFLLSILKEIPYFTGTLEVNGSLAYVEQEPNIIWGTIRDNILFGKPFDADLYKSVIEASCLEKDLSMFLNRDSTEIGEKGAMISGGQKARVSFARALYSDSDIYLLDDPFSAIDSKVSWEIYHKGIKSFLKGKTVILVTHQIEFTKDADQIIVFENGSMTLRNFNDILNYQQKRINQDELAKTETSSSTEPIEGEREEILNEKEIEEDIEDDRVSISTIFKFLKLSGSSFLMILCMAILILNEVFRFMKVRTFGLFGDKNSDQDIIFYLALSFILINTATDVLKTKLVLEIFFRASNYLYHLMLERVIRSPTRFFDKNPAGRIINHFSNDTSTIDNMLLKSIMEAGERALLFSGYVLTVMIINPWFFIPFFFLLLALFLLARIASDPYAESKKLDLVFRGPVFSNFFNTISNIMIIRVYGQQEKFKQQFSITLTRNSRCNFTFWNFNRCLGVIIDFITLTASAIGIFSLLFFFSADGTLVGQSIYYLVSIAEITNLGFRFFVYSYMTLNSVERNLSYTNLQIEDDLVKSKDVLLSSEAPVGFEANNISGRCIKKKSWLKKGHVKFHHVALRYSSELPLVLDGVSFEICPGERVGIVGRTGAGKSSLFQAFLRLTEIERKYGRIEVDGVDLLTIGLHTLRKNIAFIPQTPFLFTGSVKKNIDPEENFNTDEIYDALEEVQLKSCIDGLENKIMADMSHASSLFSVGQKQLVCLTRALLRRSKILLLDEATANLDTETDRIIQNTIREKFRDSTVITIAHRIITIADYDRVLVFDKGKLVQNDSPINLLVRQEGDEDVTEQGIFAEFVKHTGKNTSRKIVAKAKQKYFRRKNQNKIKTC